MTFYDAQRRVAVVAGLRTPFAKQGTAYAELSALDLATLVVGELFQRGHVRPEWVEQVVFGQVIPTVESANIAREVALNTALGPSVEAYSVARACATSLQATVNVAQAIRLGTIECGLAGGAESLSNVPIAVSRSLGKALMRFGSAKSVSAKLAAFDGLKPGDFVPVPPAIRERSTGLTMGESAEKMAKLNDISRAAQDAYAHRSHQLAARAWQDGLFAEDVMTVYVPPLYREHLRTDNLVRHDSDPESYAALRPVFDKRYGTVTAGNSSPLTDGAAALVLMSEEKARAEGLAPLGFLRSYAFSALDPNDQLLLGPALATPKALAEAGLTLGHMDVIDMHEAFAAQVLSNTQALESKRFAQERLGRDEAVGAIDWDKFNPLGGSIALGHPFGATGARQILHTLRELHRRGGEFALCTACAAGGLGAALVLEAA